MCQGRQPAFNRKWSLEIFKRRRSFNSTPTARVSLVRPWLHATVYAYANLCARRGFLDILDHLFDQVLVGEKRILIQII